jgi:hypothetical protein
MFVTLLQGACALLWLDNIARTGRKNRVRKLFVGGMAENILSYSLTNVIKLFHNCARNENLKINIRT